MVLVATLSPYRLKAAEPEIRMEDYEAGILYKPSEEQIKLISQANALRRTTQGQCVSAIRNFLGVGRDQVSGIAKNLIINSEIPQIGAIIKLDMSRNGHIGVIIDINKEVITYYDSNGNLNEKADVRIIKVDDIRVLGYKIVE